MQAEKTYQVIFAAAKVGGILANDTYPAEFIYDNLIMEANVIHQAHAVGVSCSIPDDHIAPRRSAFFMARSVLGEVRAGRATC